ncbi:uncharacterized protein LOC116303787 [Actinia tenebrosa]|uniref:Uncharacterized protein LOC116303787 n=1 Tax=Actinia tenebrosa TaxID=6105 RepID=A0A6P8IQR7_ACTTE|nr:uncharacterized protein LOC116303787 [Actinia tenebrosa]
MLSEENEDISDPILASLFKQSLEIDADLEFQNAMSKRDFYHEELCGWTVDQSAYHRFKWNSQRKLLKTPNKDAKAVTTNPKRSFSRQSVYRTSDIEFDFKHYQHRVKYIEQYRNEKLIRQDAGLNDILVKSTSDRRKLKSEVCDECTNHRTSPSETSDVLKLEHSEYSSNTAVTNSSIGPTYHAKNRLNTGIFHGKKLYSRPVFRYSGLHSNRETNWNEVIDSSIVGLHTQAALCKQTPPSRGMEESWTIVGVEKRPLPQQRKRTDLYSALSSKSHRKNTSSSSRYQKYSTSANKCDKWVKNREQEPGGPYGSESFRVTPRSNSAPNIYNNALGGRQSLWKSPEDSKKSHTSSLNDGKARGNTSSSSKMDYSCYTEMFKNVLDYYGTKKLQPKPKLPTAENGRLLSVKT